MLSDFAKSLKVSRNLISFKSFRKGFAVSLAFRVLEQFKGLTSVMDVIRILKGTNWKSDAAKSYLTWGENDLQMTIDRYRAMIQTENDVKPENVHVYLKDIGESLEVYFDSESPLVEFIAKEFEVYFLKNSGNSVERTKALLRRKRLAIICNLNLFCYLYTDGEVRRVKAVKKPQKLSIDFDQTYKYAPYPGHDRWDGFNRQECPHKNCHFKTSYHSREWTDHFDKIHKGQKIPCHKCDKIFGCKRDCGLHERLYHSLAYVCKTCSIMTTPLNIESCLKNHCVALSSSITIQWKSLERTSPNVECFAFGQQQPIIEKIKTKAELLSDLQSFNDRPQIGAGIIIALQKQKIPMEYLSDVEFEPFMKFVADNNQSETISELLGSINSCNLSPDIQIWSKENVSTFIIHVTGSEECGVKFFDEDIDGKALIRLEENDLNEMSMKIGNKAKIRHYLKLIQKDNS